MCKSYFQRAAIMSVLEKNFSKNYLYQKACRTKLQSPLPVSLRNKSLYLYLSNIWEVFWKSELQLEVESSI